MNLTQPGLVPALFVASGLGPSRPAEDATEVQPLRGQSVQIDQTLRILDGKRESDSVLA